MGKKTGRRGWWEDGCPYELVQEIATESQLTTFDMVAREKKTLKEAAKERGINIRNIAGHMNSIRMQLARRGWHPESGLVHPVAPGQFVKGVSTLYDESGTRLQWVKTDIDRERQAQMLEEALQAMRDDIKPYPKRYVELPDGLEESWCNLYVVTDYHLGMQAWGEETRGEDWDTGIAEELLVSWFETVISQAPGAKTAVFAQLGDFLHWDGLDAVTPTSGHILDADTRFQKIVRTAIRVLRQCIDMMLEAHEEVHIIMAEGNHDLASSIWLREMFSSFYENEGRVTVDLSPDPYYSYEFGNTALYFHHGHKRKTRELDRTFAYKFREIYGRCEHNYGHAGHYHFDKLETALMTIEQHRTLAAADAYASRGGWNSGRDAKCITYDAKHGEVGRTIVSPQMVREWRGG
jgi:hypothetical protein